MRNRLHALGLVLSVVLTLMLPVPRALEAQATSIKMLDEHGRERPSRVLPKSEIALYSLILAFYDTVLDTLKLGKGAEERLWTELGIEPDSPSSQVIWKATFRTQAMLLDIPLVPAGTTREEFEEVELRNLQRRMQELRHIYIQMIRELKDGRYPAERLTGYIDEKVRASLTSYQIGEKTGFGRRCDALKKSFEWDIQQDLRTIDSAEEERR